MTYLLNPSPLIILAIFLSIQGCSFNDSVSRSGDSTEESTELVEEPYRLQNNIELVNNAELETAKTQVLPSVQIDWSLIDTRPSVPINNTSQYTNFGDDIA